MKLHLGRIVILSVVSITTTAVFGSCASSEEGLWPESGGDASQESGGNSSFGGIGGGVGTGGSGAGGFSGTTGGSFGTGGSPVGGTGGVVGTGGVPATGGATGTGGAGTGGGGTCNPAFCPSSSVGTACCLTPNGPCGLNSGSGCATASADF